MKRLFVLLAAAFAIAPVHAQPVAESLVGQPLPPLKGLEFVQGKPDFKGKPAIIEFWATWCVPCIENIPHMNALYKQFNPKGLQIVGITQEPAPLIQRFLKKFPIDYPIAIDNSDIAAQFGVMGIPQAFVVDKTGTIIWEGHPGLLDDKAIESIL